MDKREEEIKFPKDWHRAGLAPRGCFDNNNNNKKVSNELYKRTNQKSN